MNWRSGHLQTGQTSRYSCVHSGVHIDRNIVDPHHYKLFNCNCDSDSLWVGMLKFSMINLRIFLISHFGVDINYFNICHYAYCLRSYEQLRKYLVNRLNVKNLLKFTSFVTSLFYIYSPSST